MKQNCFSNFLTSRMLVMSGLVLTSGAALAQSKWNSMSIGEITMMQQRSTKASLARGKDVKQVEPSLGAIVKMKPGHHVSELKDMGMNVSIDLGNMGIVYLKLNEAAKVDSIDVIEGVSLVRKTKKLLDKANKDTRVDAVHAGEGLNMPYTGKGVVVAILDSGFDPNHPMFLDKNGQSRVTCFVYSTQGEQGIEYQVVTDPAEIAKITTDENETHGNHVAGIAVGKVLVGDDADKFPYNGIATDAEVAMGSSTYGTVVELLDKVVEQYPGRRIVANYSIGNNEGPHDGTSYEELLLDEYLQQHPNVIFCISAGNEGSKDIVQRHTFVGDNDAMDGSFLAGDSDQESKVDMWANGSKPFDVRLRLESHTEDGQTKVLWKSDRIKFSESKAVYAFVMTDSKEGGISSDIGDATVKRENKYDAELAKLLDPDSNIILIGGLNQGNNRFNLNLNVAASLKEKVSDTYWAYEVLAEDGETVTAYTNDDVNLLGNGITHDGTISGLATGHEVISVGSYTTKNQYEYTDYSGNKVVKDYTKDNPQLGTTAWRLGEVSPFSSWDRLLDGRCLPLICAPGAEIVSSINSYYKDEANIFGGYVVRRSYKDRQYDWMGTTGTSMAAPYFAGVTALWLEANPKLTRNEIVQIAEETANHDERDKVTSDDVKVQWGAGKVDAYAGIKKALDLATAILVPINQNQKMLMREVAPRTFETYVAGANQMAAAIYTLDGQLVTTQQATGNTLRIVVPGVQKGAYVLKVSTGTDQLVRKVLVK